MKRNMVEGSIARAMVAFTVPLMLSGILQQLFNWVDAFIVGNVEGELALVNGMLANERFLSNAPEAKIAEEKEKLAKYTKMKEQVDARLEQLR